LVGFTIEKLTENSRCCDKYSCRSGKRQINYKRSYWLFSFYCVFHFFARKFLLQR